MILELSDDLEASWKAVYYTDQGRRTRQRLPKLRKQIGNDWDISDASQRDSLRFPAEC